jgi:hypothetical protein
MKEDWKRKSCLDLNLEQGMFSPKSFSVPLLQVNNCDRCDHLFNLGRELLDKQVAARTLRGSSQACFSACTYLCTRFYGKRLLGEVYLLSHTHHKVVKQDAL